MANEAAEQSGSLLRSVTRILESTASEGGYDSLIPILSLLCLISILNRGQSSAPQVAAVSPANPLQKLLGDLGKGEGGLGPDTLMSLLPLLNNPQIKNKINPTTISAVLGLINNMGDKGEKGDKGDKLDKSDKSEAKQEKPERPDRPEEHHEVKRPAPPAAALTSLEALSQKPDAADSPDADKKGLGRYLNWKSNF